MSYLARTVTPLRTVGRAFPSRSVAAFHTSSARAALSEDHVRMSPLIEILLSRN